MTLYMMAILNFKFEYCIEAKATIIVKFTLLKSILQIG